MKPLIFATKILQRKLDHNFSANAVHRGNDYFLRGAVTDLNVSGHSARAGIIGSEIYQVQLSWEQVEISSEISASCTCPHFHEGNFCKHLWSLILELDRLGISLKIPLQRRMELVMMEEDSGARVSDWPVSDWRKVFKLPAPSPKSNLTAFGIQTVFIVLETDPRHENSINLNFFSSEKNPSGVASYPRPMALPNNGYIKLGDPQLESALHAIAVLAMSELRDSNRYAMYVPEPCARTIRTQSLRFLLNSLLDTGKVFASKEDFLESIKTQKPDQRPMNLMPAGFGSMEIKVEETESGFSLAGVIAMSAKPTDSNQEPEVFVPIHNLKMFAEPNLFRWQNQIGFVDLSQTEQAWFQELAGGSLVVPKEDSEAFLEALLNQPLKFDLPVSLQWERAFIKPLAKLQLTADKQKLESNQGSSCQSRYFIDLKLQYGPRSVSYSAAGVDLASVEDRKIYSRDAVEEERIFGLLPSNLMVMRSRNNNEELPVVLPVVNSRNLFEFVKAALAAGIPTVVENKRVQEANDFKIAVNSGVDWFEVDGQADFCGRWVKFPTILEAISKGENFVPLPDGSVGIMSEQMAQRLNKLVNFAESTKDGLRFGKAQGLILNSLLENEQNVKLDAAFKRLREKIKNFSGVEAGLPPPSFQGKLRKYQRDGLGWLSFLESFGLGGILADDMGLGKTIQCLAFLESRRAAKKRRGGPSLLLAPKSLLSNWQAEAHKFTPEMRVHIHAGLDRETSPEFFKKQDLIITTYHTMLRDLDFLKEMAWDCLILDEAQAIKNPEALISKASKLLPSKFRLAMTGTPIENSIQDLFSLSDFVNPGFLNGKKRSVHLKLNEDTKDTLAKAFKPVLLRRTKEQVLKDLPEKTEQLISVELESKQLKAYNELKRFYQSQLMTEIKEKGVNKSKIKILAALTRLRQAALHPGLIDPAHAKTKSAKFEVVLEMLDEVISEGHRVLIFSQFTSLLSLLKKELDQRKIKFCYLDGKTNKRQQVVGEFKSKDFPVFLMSLKAGGVGLNLVEADYVFLLDPWWNPAVEAQAIDRIHRIGQKRAVNAYRFIAKNTVEEKILELQQTKKGISAEIFGQKSDLIRNLTAMDIENLLA